MAQQQNETEVQETAYSSDPKMNGETDRAETKQTEKKEKAKSKKKADKTEKNEALEKALQENQELNDKLLRQFAEFDNFRKRTQKEKESTFSDAKVKTLTPLIEIFDNFERALQAKTQDISYQQGIEMIFNQFQEKLQALGVEEIEALGQKLDPLFHQAVMHIEDPEKGESEIVAVLQKGYKIGDKVLRCSMVQVAN